MATTINVRSVVVAFAVIGGAAAWALWPKPIDVDTDIVMRKPIEVRVEEEGVSRIRDVYAVSAPMPGQVRRSPFKVGDAVVAGETVVATIEPADPVFLDDRTQKVADAAVEAARAAVDLAEAQVRQARAQLEFARSELQRARQLSARQATSERALDQAQLNAASAEAAVSSAEATLDLKRHELASAEAQRTQPNTARSRQAGCCIEVRAPASGRVLKLAVESQQVVQAGQPLVEIGDPDNLEIVVDLLSRDAVRVKEGAPAQITNWGGAGALHATLRRIEPAGFTKVSALGIEEQRVRVILDLADPREVWRALGHGFRVIAEITIAKKEAAIVVPVAALFRRGEVWAVYVVRDGRARAANVTLGERNLREAEVLSGLEPGAEIVLYPSDKLSDGAAVAARPKANAG